MVYLIPETVSLTGVPDEMKKMKDGIGQHHQRQQQQAARDTLQQIAKHTKMTADERMK